MQVNTNYLIKQQSINSFILETLHPSITFKKIGVLHPKNFYIHPTRADRAVFVR